jgi:hypothetical protein
MKFIIFNIFCILPLLTFSDVVIIILAICHNLTRFYDFYLIKIII